MQYSRGDIVLVLYPESDLQTAKRRPVLIIQADNLNTGLSQVVVAMITSNISRAGHPSRVEITTSSPEGSVTGLQLDSVVMTDNIATVRVTEIDRRLGVWAGMEVVDAALRVSLGI